MFLKTGSDVVLKNKKEVQPFFKNKKRGSDVFLKTGPDVFLTKKKRFRRFLKKKTGSDAS